MKLRYKVDEQFKSTQRLHYDISWKKVHRIFESITSMKCKANALLRMLVHLVAK